MTIRDTAHMAPAIHKVSISIRPDDRKALTLTRELTHFFSAKGVSCMLPDYDIVLEDDKLSPFIAHPDDYMGTPDLVIVIGGDGTFLRAARDFSAIGQPIFGINKGRLGFLTEFDQDDALVHLERVIAGDYAVSERTMLEAIHTRLGSEIGRNVFFNDAVISKGAFSRPIKLRLEIDGQYLNSYSGDGIIVATATGSTAYSLSAGGPIIFPSIPDVYIINPVCPHMMGIRPMIVPTSSVLSARIISDFEFLLLTIDGQEAIRIEGDDQVIFRKSEKMVKVVNHHRHHYYEILREKLGWGRNLEK